MPILIYKQQQGIVKLLNLNNEIVLYNRENISSFHSQILAAFCKSTRLSRDSS